VPARRYIYIQIANTHTHTHKLNLYHAGVQQTHGRVRGVSARRVRAGGHGALYAAPPMQVCYLYSYDLNHYAMLLAKPLAGMARCIYHALYTGTQLTCFTSTKVQILTLRTRSPVDLAPVTLTCFLVQKYLLC